MERTRVRSSNFTQIRLFFRIPIFTFGCRHSNIIITCYRSSVLLNMAEIFCRAERKLENVFAFEQEKGYSFKRATPCSGVERWRVLTIYGYPWVVRYDRAICLVCGRIEAAQRRCTYFSVYMGQARWAVYQPSPLRFLRQSMNDLVRWNSGSQQTVEPFVGWKSSILLKNIHLPHGHSLRFTGNVFLLIKLKVWNIYWVYKYSIEVSPYTNEAFRQTI